MTQSSTLPRTPSGLMEELSEASVREPVPAAQKTMPLDKVFWSHFSPNLGPGGWVTGALLSHMGLDFATGVAALVLGNVLGALPVACAAAIGPATGLTQMEASRRALGRLGVRPPAFLNWIYCVGWDAVNNVPAATALVALLVTCGLHAPFWLALAVLAGVQMAASIYGCLLYTPDAADEPPCLDLGGRRINKQTTKLYLHSVVVETIPANVPGLVEEPTR